MYKIIIFKQKICRKLSENYVHNIDRLQRITLLQHRYIMKLNWEIDPNFKTFKDAKYGNYELNVWIDDISSGIDLVEFDEMGGSSLGFLEFDMKIEGFDEILMDGIEHIADDQERVKTVLNSKDYTITLNVHNLLNIFMFGGIEEKKGQS